MLRGAEWIFPVKINAHTCSERKRLKLQLCMIGGRGGRRVTQNKEKRSRHGQTGTQVVFFGMCVYFEDTGKTGGTETREKSSKGRRSGPAPAFGSGLDHNPGLTWAHTSQLTASDRFEI